MFETWLPMWLNIISVTDFFSLFSSSVQEMTIPWCLKRAELVFKCVKGVQAKISNVKLQKPSLIINILYHYIKFVYILLIILLNFKYIGLHFRNLFDLILDYNIFLVKKKKTYPFWLVGHVKQTLM